MIQVATYPDDLKLWKPPDMSPFYLEVFGETKPFLDQHYAEVLPPGLADGTAAQTTAATPVYEYWWTIGHHVHETDDQLDKDQSPVWYKFDAKGIAARVFMFFPVCYGWRIKELAATVKYLSPVREADSLLSAIAKDWKEASPYIGVAGQVASLAAVVPEVGPVFKGASDILDALAKLQINSVPPAGDFKWSVAKVTDWDDECGVLQGVMWELPGKMFDTLGSRLTGSLALSFIPVCAKGHTECTGPTPGDLRAHAFVYPKDDKPVRGPKDIKTSVRLELSPH